MIGFADRKAVRPEPLSRQLLTGLLLRDTEMIEENFFYKQFQRLINNRIGEGKTLEEEALDEDSKWDDLRWTELSNIFDDLKRKGVDTDEIWTELKVVSGIITMFESYGDIVQSVIEDTWGYLEDVKKLEIPPNLFKSHIFPSDKVRAAYCVLLEESQKVAEWEEFMDWVKEMKKKAGAKPYGGEEVSRMPIFTELIGFLGDTLRCHFLTEQQKKRKVLLTNECSKIIAKILNSFFFQLNLEFDHRQVYRRYENWYY